ncbi:MAG: hypothetical protein JWQ38_2842 [Flavipsychrobacter sp.]|nr:hypothetical protein [Flavipsychrobacter sp.]
MKKIFYILPLLVVSSITSIAQTTAIDFTANDCSGTSHHLFAELDAGKIVVVSFVMPCGACISPSMSANTAVNSYATSHPGKVLFYISDDAANTTCASLNAWASTNGMSGITTFSAAAFNQLDYGTAAMPKLVVLAGTDHKVIYKEDNALNSTAMKTAINTALASSTTGVATTLAEKNNVSISPNPVTNNFNINYAIESPATVTMNIYNVAGAKVKTIAAGEQKAGKHEINVKLDGSLANGMYLLEMNTGKTTNTVKFTIAN